MSGANTFGRFFRVTTFGESHGPAVGAVIDGCPAGVPWDDSLLRKELQRRRPGTAEFVSSRQEPDEPKLLSGVFQGKTLGTPIALLVENRDTRPEDYDAMLAAPRNGHADDLWKAKFGNSDHRGGGRSSGRETLARVLGGAVARMLLRETIPSLKIVGFSRNIGPICGEEEALRNAWNNPSPYPFDQFTARLPGTSNQPEVEALLRAAKEEGRSYGGTVEVRILGAPAGLGEPVFHKLKNDLASACLSIGAVNAFEMGAGFEASSAEGTAFHREARSASYGGIRGGISTGEAIVFRVGFKPTASVLRVAQRGRHDPCIVPRAIPVLEAMTALVIADHVQAQRGNRLPRA